MGVNEQKNYFFAIHHFIYPSEKTRDYKNKKEDWVKFPCVSGILTIG
jgi:hypothetical protein